MGQRQIKDRYREKSEQTGRQRRWGGWKTSSKAEQLVKRATVAPKVKAEVERKGRGRRKKDKCGIGESVG